MKQRITATKRKQFDDPEFAAYWSELRVQIARERRIRDCAETGAPEGSKRCNTCHDWKPESAFSKLTSAWDGLQNRCKECQKIVAARAPSKMARMAKCAA